MQTTLVPQAESRKSPFPRWVLLAARESGLEPAYVKQLVFGPNNVFDRVAGFVSAMVREGHRALAERRLGGVDEARRPHGVLPPFEELEALEEAFDGREGECQLAFARNPCASTWDTFDRAATKYLDALQRYLVAGRLRYHRDLPA